MVNTGKSMWVASLGITEVKIVKFQRWFSNFICKRAQASVGLPLNHSLVNYYRQ